MKKFFSVLGILLMLGFAGSAMSATLTLNAVGDTDFTGDSQLSDLNAGFNITHTIDLNVVSALKVNSFELNNIVDFLTYELYDSTNALVTVYNFFNVTNSGNGTLSSAGFDTGILAVGDYFLKISGRVSGPGKGSFHTQVEALGTPIPAAIWLFGSALVGLVGASRRKAGLAA